MKKFTRVLCAITLFACVALLVACAPKDAEAAKAKLDKAGYTAVIVYDNPERPGSNGEVANVTASDLNKLLSGTALTATLYDTAKDAKAAYNKAKENADDDTNVKLVGKWVVIGEKGMVKAFK